MKEIKVFENSDEFIINQVCEILKDNDINYIRKDEGIGSYLNITMGTNLNLKEIFVSDEDYKKASKKIEDFLSKTNIEIPEELKDYNEEDEQYLEKEIIKTNKMKKIIFVWIPLIMIITVIIVAILN